MPAATVTSKGQITIPAEVRKELGLKAGSRVDFVRVGHATFEIVPATLHVTALKGIVPALSEPVSIEQMNEAIADAAAGL
jgi:antitoxin PrlF